MPNYFNLLLDIHNSFWYSLTMKKQLLEKINEDLKKTNLTALAKLMGLNQPTLFRLVTGQNGGRIDTWEKIEKYYFKKKE